MNRIAIALAAGALGFAGMLADARAQSLFLDPNNPLANFELDGSAGYTPGSSMLMTDAGPNAHIAFYAATPVAASGNVVDVTAAFRIQANDSPSGVDTGMRLVVTDGAVTSFIAGCVTLGGIPGMAIAIGSNFAAAENYAGFVPVDWINPVTVTIRRHANGDAEFMQVNGVAVSPGSTLVPVASLAGPVLAYSGVGFGLFSDPAFTTVEVEQFSAVAVTPIPEPETYALMLAGLALLGFQARRSNKSKGSLLA